MIAESCRMWTNHGSRVTGEAPPSKQANVDPFVSLRFSRSVVRQAGKKQWQSFRVPYPYPYIVLAANFVS